MINFITVLLFALVVAIPAFARAVVSKPILSGECSEKTWNYVRMFGDVIPCKFYRESDEWQWDAKLRFEKNKAAFEDLFGWRISHNDFFKGHSGKKISATSDILAKYSLICTELLSGKLNESEPEIARAQFDMGLDLTADIFSEWGEYSKEIYATSATEIIYDKENNLVCGMEEFLQARQRCLWQLAHSDSVSNIVREIRYWSGDDPEKVYAFIKRISPLLGKEAREADVIPFSSVERFLQRYHRNGYSDGVILKRMNVYIAKLNGDNPAAEATLEALARMERRAARKISKKNESFNNKQTQTNYKNNESNP